MARPKQTTQKSSDTFQRSLYKRPSGKNLTMKAPHKVHFMDLNSCKESLLPSELSDDELIITEMQEMELLYQCTLQELDIKLSDMPISGENSWKPLDKMQKMPGDKPQRLQEDHQTPTV